VSEPQPPPIRRVDTTSLARRLPVRRSDDQPLARTLPVDRPAERGDNAPGHEGLPPSPASPMRIATAALAERVEQPGARIAGAGLTGDERSPVSASAHASWSRLHSSSLQLNLATVKLVVSPFETFVELGRFQPALSGLPGVRAVRPRRLQRGVLQLRIECRTSTELLDGLAAHWPFPFRLISCEPYRVEIVLDDRRAPIERDPTARA